MNDGECIRQFTAILPLKSCFLQRFPLPDYKNYQYRELLILRKGLSEFAGLNGKGKTNLLDAINYLCFTKSYFTKSDILNTHFGEEGFRLEGELQNEIEENNHAKDCVYLSRLHKKKNFIWMMWLMKDFRNTSANFRA